MPRFSMLPSLLLMVAGAFSSSSKVTFGSELFKLLASDGRAGAEFGYSVGVNGSAAIIGAHEAGGGRGAAYLFDFNTGNEFAKLAPNDLSSFADFGHSVAISDGVVIVGAPGDQENFGGRGSAYVFDVATGNQIAKFRPSDLANNDFFGYSVGIHGTIAIIGSYMDTTSNGVRSGSAYLFDINSGSQISKLLASDGAANDHLGISVAIHGNTAIVGAYLDDHHGPDSGSAYLFDTTTGNQIAKLLPDDGAANHYFGTDVDINNTTAIVGAQSDDDNGVNSGSAYLFDITTGNQIAKLLPIDGKEGDRFGYSVGISGRLAVVGSIPPTGTVGSTGSAYLFDIFTGQQLAKFTPNTGTAIDTFGLSVAIGGNSVIVGAHRDSELGTRSGAAYLFDATSYAVPEPSPFMMLFIAAAVGMTVVVRQRYS